MPYTCRFSLRLQGIYDGYQTELPDYWLVNGNPWEIERIDVQCIVNIILSPATLLTVPIYGPFLRSCCYHSNARWYSEGNSSLFAIVDHRYILIF